MNDTLTVQRLYAERSDMVVATMSSPKHPQSIGAKIMQSTTTAPAHLLNRREAAAYLSVSQRKLDQLTANGEINRIKIDACVRFDPSDLNAFIAKCKSV